MATTVADAFSKLKANLEISGLQESSVSARQQHVRQVVSSGLTIHDSFLTGSYSRSTMIAPLGEADLDVFFVLDPSYFRDYEKQNGGPAGLLDLMKRTLRKTYTQTPDISRNGQAVTIRFTDYAVDVVPGFRRQGGGYLIPNSISQSWISTDPKAHVEISARANDAHNGDFVPLVKMIKGWNRIIGRAFGSFHLEVMAFMILNGVTISDFPSGMRFFFDKARDRVRQQNPDPAGYGGDVGLYINTEDKIQLAVSKFQAAFDYAVRAEDLGRRGLVRDSIENWRKVFGDYFPAYG